MNKEKLHTQTHIHTYKYTYKHTYKQYKLYQMTFKTSKQQINKLHSANQLTDLVLSE